MNFYWKKKYNGISISPEPYGIGRLKRVFLHCMHKWRQVESHPCQAVDIYGSHTTCVFSICLLEGVFYIISVVTDDS
jgi:hypothetical protein